MKAHGLQVQRLGATRGRMGARSGSVVTHPVLALQRAAGNRAVAGLVVQRKAGGTAKARALARLNTEFGITTVREGTVAEQAQRLAGGAAGLTADEAQKQLAGGGWAEWSPPEKSADWTAMVDGVARFAATVGLPAVSEILFFDRDYDVGADGRLVPRRDVGASFATGSLLVFAKGTRGRFVAAARREAGAASNTTRENVGYEMTHELGHGVVEKAMKGDASVVTRYAAAVGWVGGRLYDIGRPEVAEALAAHRAPPAAALLTAGTWERADVVEQPMAEYMTLSPAEDLPEAIAAYVNRPDVLKARSPHRFAFVDGHMADWRKGLRAAP